MAHQQSGNVKLPLMAAARLAFRPRGTYADPSLSRCSDDDDNETWTSSSDSGSNSSYKSSVASDDTDSSLLTNAFLAPRPFSFRDKPFLPGTKSSSLSDLPRFFYNYNKLVIFNHIPFESPLHTTYYIATKNTHNHTDGHIRNDVKNYIIYAIKLHKKINNAGQ